jgi:hypothetical protein
MGPPSTTPIKRFIRKIGAQSNYCHRANADWFLSVHATENFMNEASLEIKISLLDTF